jgi:hypothetical protein
VRPHTNRFAGMARREEGRRAGNYEHHAHKHGAWHTEQPPTCSLDRLRILPNSLPLCTQDAFVHPNRLCT